MHCGSSHCFYSSVSWLVVKIVSITSQVSKTNKREKFLRKVKSLTKFRGIRKLFDLGEYSQLYASIERDKYSRYHHENTVFGYVETMYCGDLTAKQEDLADQLENLLTETIRDLSCKLYRDLESAYDDQFTDEAITESIEANDYRFDIDEDGKVYAIA